MRLLLDVLAEGQPGRSRSDLRKLLADGRVTVNDQVVKVARTPVADDATVAVRGYGVPARTTEPQPTWPFIVVYADDDLLVIDKPAGLMTSSGPRDKRPTALAIARKWAGVERPRAKVGLVHRPCTAIRPSRTTTPSRPPTAERCSASRWRPGASTRSGRTSAPAGGPSSATCATAGRGCPCCG